METELQQTTAPLLIATEVRNKAKTDPILHAVCEVFAKRQRARAHVTLDHLTRTMRINGAPYARSQYAGVLKFLSSLGVGTLKHNKSGELISLSDIKYKLQAIGKAGSGADLTAVTGFTTREGLAIEPLKDISFNKMPGLVSPPIPKSVNRKLRAYNIFLTAIVDGQPVVFQGPQNLPPEEFGMYISNFNALSRKEGNT